VKGASSPRERAEPNRAFRHLQFPDLLSARRADAGILRGDRHV
jgi:hypothetical protein